MVFGNFEDIIPISICFNQQINFLILKWYSKALIHLMKNLKDQIDIEKYKEELQIKIISEQQNSDFYKSLYPSNNLELDFIIPSKSLVLPERLENSYIVDNLGDIRYIEDFIHQSLEAFISKYNMKKVIEFVMKNQYHNIFVDLTKNESLIREKIAQVTPYNNNGINDLYDMGISRKEIRSKIPRLSYYNLLLGTSTQQRSFRYFLNNFTKKIYSGNIIPEQADILKFLKLINWLSKFEMFKFHIKKKMNIFLIENSLLTFFYIPIFEREKLKDQKLGNIQINRLDLMGLKFPITETGQNPYNLLFTERWSDKYNKLKELHNKFKSPFEDQVYFLNQDQIYEYRDLLEKDYSPFSYLIKKGHEKVFFTSKIQLTDAHFRFNWIARHEDHIKIYGTAFEDFVSDQLERRSQYSLLPNKYFMRKQYDQFLYGGGILFVIDSKDLKFREDVTDRSKINARKSELKKYCKYLEEKTFLLRDNFSDFIKIYPQFSELKYFIPVIISHNPELYLEFHNVCIITLEEFLEIYKKISMKINDRPIRIRGNILEGKNAYPYSFNFYPIKNL